MSLPESIIEKPHSFSRRWLLRGLGAAALPIPVLSSLLSPREAHAQAQTRMPIFLPVLLQQSNVGKDSMCPSGAPDETMSYAGFTIRRTALKPTVNGGLTSVSPVLTASASMLTPSLVAKMNILRGIDWPRSMGHNGTQLGCYSAEAIDPATTTLDPTHYRRSVDQVMAQSSAFYGTGFNGITKVATFSWAPVASFASRTLVVSANGQAVGGGTSTCQTAEALFNLFFGQAQPQPGARKSTVDLVKESYSRLSKSPRLARVDKDRLDEHVQRLADLDRRLNVVRAPCSTPARPQTPAPAPDSVESHAASHEVVIDTTVAALACGLTRIIVLPIHSPFATQNADDWHQSVEHHANEDDYVAQRKQVSAVRETFARFVVPLAAKLDAVSEGNGKTLLDRTMLFQVPPMGDVGHSTTGRVFVTFGSADGAMRTGNHLDYRNLEQTPMSNGIMSPEFATSPVGLTMQQFYASLLQVMGVPRAEWDEPTTYGGYGPRFADSERVYPGVSWSALIGSQYSAQVWQRAGEMLPWLGAA